MDQAATFASYDKYLGANDVVSEDISIGSGETAVSGLQATVDYRGWLTSGEIFDESYARGQTFSFQIGAGMVIRGWDEGVIGMKVGGKRRLIVPPAAGYGNRPIGSIPAYSVLVFEVELKAVA